MTERERTTSHRLAIARRVLLRKSRGKDTYGGIAIYDIIDCLVNKEDPSLEEAGLGELPPLAKLRQEIERLKVDT